MRAYQEIISLLWMGCLFVSREITAQAIMRLFKWERLTVLDRFAVLSQMKINNFVCLSLIKFSIRLIVLLITYKCYHLMDQKWCQLLVKYSRPNNCKVTGQERFILIGKKIIQFQISIMVSQSHVEISIQSTWLD